MDEFDEYPEADIPTIVDVPQTASDLIKNGLLPMEMDDDANELVDLPVTGEVEYVGTFKKPKRQRKRKKKEICTGSLPENVNTTLANKEETEKRTVALEALQGLIESDFPAAFHEMAASAQKEEQPKPVKPADTPTSMFRTTNNATTPQNQKLLLKNIMTTCPNRIMNVLDVIMRAVPISFPKSSATRTREELMNKIELVFADWIAANLRHPHGNWPGCSRPIVDAAKNQPRSISTGWTPELCAILLCDRVKVPFLLRAFYPLESDAESYLKNNNFPDDVPPLCVLCQMCDMHSLHVEIQEQQTISLPEFCSQTWRVEVDVIRGFSSIVCCMPSDRGFNGLIFPIPIFAPHYFKDGKPISDPLYGPVPLPTLEMEYDKLEDIMKKTQSF